MKVRMVWICLSVHLLLAGVAAAEVDPSICSEGLPVVLHDSGMLQSCNLKRNYEVNGITCQGDNEITFYPTGALESCTLYEESTINGIACEPEEMVTFYQDGNLYMCVKKAD